MVVKVSEDLLVAEDPQSDPAAPAAVQSEESAVEIAVTSTGFRSLRPVLHTLKLYQKAAPNCLRCAAGNSARLHGVHRLTRRFLVEIDATDHRQRVTKAEAEQNPVFQCGSEFPFTRRFMTRAALLPSPPMVNAHVYFFVVSVH